MSKSKYSVSLDDIFLISGRRIEIDLYNMSIYIKEHGFFRIDDCIYNVKNNIASYVSMDAVTTFIYEQMFKARNNRNTITHEYSQHRSLFTQNIGKYISAIYKTLGIGNSNDINYLRDTKDHTYLCFLNGIVDITKDDISLKPYHEILKKGKIILNNKIIKRNIIINQETISTGDFYQFAKLAMTNDNKNNLQGFTALKSAIGYMVSTYKDPSTAKMIFFSDVNNSDKIANGRSGKSLCSSTLLKQIREVAIVDGKQYDGNYRFKMENVTSTTDVVVLQDVKPDFDKEVLYNMITNDCEIAKKYKEKQVIPFELSPKFIADSNFGINLSGTSDEARFTVIGFSHYWNYDNQPIDTFKKRFFSDWNDIEWNKFYNFIFNCCKTYLNKGLSDWRKNEIVAFSIYEIFDKDLVDEIISILEKRNNFLITPHSTDFWLNNISYFSGDKSPLYSKINILKKIMRHLGFTKYSKHHSFRDENGKVSGEKLHWFEKDYSINISNFDNIKNYKNSQNNTTTF